MRRFRPHSLFVGLAGLLGLWAGLRPASVVPSKAITRGAAHPPALVAPEPPPAPLRVPPLPPLSEPAPKNEGVACDGRFRVIAFNDLQARYSDRIQGRSKYAYLSGLLHKLRKEVPHAIVVDAGDDYEKGSLVDLRSNGEATRQVIQALPIDVRTLGNHDFAYGHNAVRRDVTESKHPVLSANLEGDLPFQSFVSFATPCVRIGVTGLTTRNYGSDDRLSEVPYFGSIVHRSNYAEIVDGVFSAHGELDVRIALNHIGLYEDIGLAAKSPNVDLVIGGHSEDLTPYPPIHTRSDGRKVWISQAGHFGDQVSVLDFRVDAASKRLVLERYQLVKVDASAPFDDHMDGLVKKLEAEYVPELHEPVANFTDPIHSYDDLAPALAAMAKSTWKADAVLLGRDLFWKSFSPGKHSLQSIYDAMYVQKQPAGTPGFSSLFEIESTGAELQRMGESLRKGPQLYWSPPTVVEADRKYRVLIEKRALENPKLAFYAPFSLGGATFKGELIDLAEEHFRSPEKAEALLSLTP